MRKSHKTLRLSIVFWVGFSSLAATDKQQLKVREKIFFNRKFSKLACESGLKKVEKKFGDEIEVACEDLQGKLQGISIRLDSKGKKVRAHIYRDNKITDEQTVEWDDEGKVNYTEEPNLRTTWYNFKKKRKHIETTIAGDRRETREWYPNGKLQSLSIEQEGLPTQVVGWDIDGNRLGTSP